MPHKRAKKSIRDADKSKKGFNLPPSSSGVYTDDTPRGGARVLNSIAVRQAFRDCKRSSEDTGASSKSKGKGKGKAPTNSSTSSNASSSSLPKILPSESIGEYNRRLESHTRADLSQAMKAAESKKAQEEKEVWMRKRENRLKAKEERRERLEGGKGKGKGKAEEGSDDDDEEESGKVNAKKATVNKGKRKADTLDEDATNANLFNNGSGPKLRKTEFEKAPLRRSVNDVVQAPPSLPMLKRAKTGNNGTGTAPAGAFAAAAKGKNPLNAGQQRLMEEERERVIRRYREMKEKRLREREETNGEESWRTKKMGRDEVEV